MASRGAARSSRDAAAGSTPAHANGTASDMQASSNSSAGNSSGAQQQQQARRRSTRDTGTPTQSEQKTAPLKEKARGAAATPPATATTGRSTPVARSSSSSSGTGTRASKLSPLRDGEERVRLPVRLPSGRAVCIRSGEAADADDDGERESGAAWPADDAAAMSDAPDTLTLDRGASTDSRPGASPAASPASSRAGSPAARGSPSPSDASPEPDDSDANGRRRDDGSSPSPDDADDTPMDDGGERKEMQAVLSRVRPPVRPLPPKPKRKTLDDLPTFQRPPLRHFVAQERRALLVRPVINGETYPQQLIDDTQTLKRFVPVPQSSALHPQHAHGHVAHMTPLIAPRGVAGAGGAASGASLLHGRHHSLTQPPALTSRKADAKLEAPGSPPTRLSSGGGALSSPALARHQSLIAPMPPQQVEGPPSDIVTQLIPYGRLQLVPQRCAPVLCASSVPQYINSTGHQWYLPRSQPGVLYITLELPGQIDFEIALTNVFLLPAPFDERKLQDQQQLLFEGKLTSQNLPPATGSGGVKPRMLLSEAAHAGSKRPRSQRRGGHLQRKRSTLTELQLLEQQDENSMDERLAPPRMTAADKDMARGYGDRTRYGPPKLKDVHVSIRSAGQQLVPAPSRIVHVPERGGKTFQRREAGQAALKAWQALPVVKPQRKDATPATVTQGAAAAAPAVAAVPALPAGSTATVATAVTAAVAATPVPHRLAGAVFGIDMRGPTDSLTPVVIPAGPCMLSAANPRIDFAGGSISVERCKPRLGGWVLRRELSLQAARDYQPANEVAVEAFKVKKAAEPVPTEPTKKDGRPPLLLASEQCHKDALATTTAAPGERDVPRCTQPYSAVYEPAHLLESQHDIAEVGDVIRLVLDVPGKPAPGPRGKAVPPMRYELMVEGLRVLPTTQAQTFPTPIEMYRYGTAPKELVMEDAKRTRLTSSTVPSELLARNRLLHWSELGLPSQLTAPVVLPEAVLPASSDEEESSSDESDASSAEKRQRTNFGPSSSNAAYRALVEHPQQNMQEWYARVYPGLVDSSMTEEVLAENEELQKSSSDESEISDWTSESEGSQGSRSGSDGEYDSAGHGSDDDGSPRKHRTSFAPNSGGKDKRGAGAGQKNVNARGPPQSSRQAERQKQLSASGRQPGERLKPGPKPGSKRTPSQTARNAAAANDDDSMEWEAAPDEVWACCDKCGKWRRLPPGIREDELPKVWFCHMNPDTTHNLCKHAEEQESQDSYAINPPAQTSAAEKNKARKEQKAAAAAGSTDDKDKSAPASQAAQAAHMLALYPPPRLPTVDDVCTTCESALVTGPEQQDRLTDTAHTLFCHGLCGRMWHRKCATVDATAAGNLAAPAAASPTPASSAATTPTAAAASSAVVSLAPTPQTHVMPFTPATTPYWYCSGCFTLTGHCFSCFEAGTCDPRLDRVVDANLSRRRRPENPDFLLQCPFQAGCGKLYHSKCLFELPRTMTHKPSRTNAGGKEATGVLTPNLVPRPRAGLICGLHACDTCGSAGTLSTNVRDIGRTLLQCQRCPVAYHWSTRCRSGDDRIKSTTRKWGVCEAHEEEGEDAEDADVIKRRNDSLATIRLMHGVAPQALFGIEPPPPEEDSSSDDDEDGEDDEDDDAAGDKDDDAKAKTKSTGTKGAFSYPRTAPPC